MIYGEPKLYAYKSFRNGIKFNADFPTVYALYRSHPPPYVNQHSLKAIYVDL